MSRETKNFKLMAQCAKDCAAAEGVAKKLGIKERKWLGEILCILHDKQDIFLSEVWRLLPKEALRNFTILHCLQSPVIVLYRSSLWWILWRSTGTRSSRTWSQTTAPASPPTRISCAILGTDPRLHNDPHYFPIMFEFKITLQFYDYHFVIILSMYMQCCGSAMASMRIRIQFLSISGSGSGSRKPNQCGASRIQILARLLIRKKLKNILDVGNRSKNIPTRTKAENQVYLLILVNFCAPGSGSKTVKMRIQVDPDPQHYRPYMFSWLIKYVYKSSGYLSSKLGLSERFKIDTWKMVVTHIPGSCVAVNLPNIPCSL